VRCNNRRQARVRLVLRRAFCEYDNDTSMSRGFPRVHLHFRLPEAPPEAPADGTSVGLPAIFHPCPMTLRFAPRVCVFPSRRPFCMITVGTLDTPTIKSVCLGQQPTDENRWLFRLPGQASRRWHRGVDERRAFLQSQRCFSQQSPPRPKAYPPACKQTKRARGKSGKIRRFIVNL